MFPHKSPGKNALRALLCAISLVCTGSLAQWLPARLTDPGDGMLDLSEHLLEHRGILPVPIVITEPAVGYGGGLVGIFFDKPLGDALKTSLGETGKAVPPNITAVGALGTRMEPGARSSATVTPGRRTVTATSAPWARWMRGWTTMACWARREPTNWMVSA
jgi:hypothetical protein